MKKQRQGSGAELQFSHLLAVPCRQPRNAGEQEVCSPFLSFIGKGEIDLIPSGVKRRVTFSDMSVS